MTDAELIRALSEHLDNENFVKLDEFFRTISMHDALKKQLRKLERLGYIKIDWGYTDTILLIAVTPKLFKAI